MFTNKRTYNTAIKNELLAISQALKLYNFQIDLDRYRDDPFRWRTSRTLGNFPQVTGKELLEVFQEVKWGLHYHS